MRELTTDTAEGLAVIVAMTKFIEDFRARSEVIRDEGLGRVWPPASNW